MDKNAIKKFAVWARKELIERVSKKALAYGITEHEVYNPDADSVNGLVLTAAQKKERKALTEQIFAKGYKQVMEEVGYTWFNRFCALRFMEVNGFLPSLVRVFTNDKNEFRPQLLTEALELDLPGLDKQKIYELKEANADEELYKYLLITQCNALNDELPRMFQRIEDYTELLFPDNLLREGSVIEQMITLIPEEDWQDAVQIIGWLYQYYNIEPKKEVFANLDKNIKIGKNDIPAATQLFTPDWIVRYMVENSLGRLVNNANSDNAQPTTTNYPLESWKYYLPEAEQETEVRNQLAQLSTTNFSLTTTKCIDPCMGSGHILAYLFDVLMEVYRSEGYRDRDAVKNIINNNLYGLDIDERAAQLAYFAVMMQGRKYDNRFLTRHYQPHIYAITESNGIDRELLAYFGVELDDLNRENALNQLNGMLDEMEDACEYGSLITVSEYDFALLKDFVAAYDAEQNLFASGALAPLQERLQQLIAVAEMLAQKYEVVVTNPPYMGAGHMNPKLSGYLKKHYPNSKSDLFAVFMEKGNSMVCENGYNCMVTMQSWMFLSSFEKMRKIILQTKDITNIMHMENMVMGIAFGTAVSIIRNSKTKGYRGTYNQIKLCDIVDDKPVHFPVMENRFAQVSSDNFAKIPGAPVAYWVSENDLLSFDRSSLLSDISNPKQGLITGNVNKFVRKWFEINDCKFSVKSGCKWYPYCNGGNYRKWYGNNEDVVDWFDDGREVKNFFDENGKLRSRPQNQQFYFQEGGTWTAISSSTFSVRYFPKGYIFSNAGMAIFTEINLLLTIIGFLNSKITRKYLSIYNEGLNYNQGDIAKLPIVNDLSDEILLNVVKQNISFSKSDWDSFETSWDFAIHPLLSTKHELLADAYASYKQIANERFAQLKANEEELNRIFIDIYGLQDELTPEVEEKDVTVHRIFDSKDDVPEAMKGSNYILTQQQVVKSLISYAVGCMFGRYSLDKPGLVYAGGEISDQWIEISGQYYLREVVEKYVAQELQRTYSMAEINVADGGDLPIGEITATRGAIFTFGSDAKSSNINSVQYCRGTSKKLYEGIRELSVNSQGIKCGAGNTAYDLCSPEILDAIASGTGSELVQRGWQDADSIDWQAIHCKLTTNHYGADKDAIIPISDNEYFNDDIVARFVEFIKTAFGADEKTLEANLNFIATALGGNGSARDVIRAYFNNGFYADHCKTYQKRPIYWLFDSGKKNGFKCLIYMHRYQKDTIARIRTDYLHEQQSRYRTAISDLQNRIDNAASTGVRVKLQKQLATVQAQVEEARLYEEKIHHLADQMLEIDLDDGVKHNYAIFKDVLTKIK